MASWRRVSLWKQPSHCRIAVHRIPAVHHIGESRAIAESFEESSELMCTGTAPAHLRFYRPWHGPALLPVERAHGI